MRSLASPPIFQLSRRAVTQIVFRAGLVNPKIFEAADPRVARRRVVQRFPPHRSHNTTRRGLSACRKASSKDRGSEALTGGQKSDVGRQTSKTKESFRGLCPIRSLISDLRPPVPGRPRTPRVAFFSILLGATLPKLYPNLKLF